MKRNIQAQVLTCQFINRSFTIRVALCILAVTRPRFVFTYVRCHVTLMLTSDAPFIAVDKSDNIIKIIRILNLLLSSNLFRKSFSPNSIKNEISSFFPFKKRKNEKTKHKKMQ